MYGMLPPEVFASCPADIQAEEMAAYLAALDRRGAELLDVLAEKHRDWFAEPRNAVFARRVLRMVAAHLRESRR
ncbi:MAG: hypothetical protein IT424_03930 [Pirellulales bacterium]|nr:hypothetical protein [Pirellulales bacterium]